MVKKMQGTPQILAALAAAKMFLVSTASAAFRALGKTWLASRVLIDHNHRQQKLHASIHKRQASPVAQQNREPSAGDAKEMGCCLILDAPEHSCLIALIETLLSYFAGAASTNDHVPGMQIPFAYSGHSIHLPASRNSEVEGLRFARRFS